KPDFIGSEMRVCDDNIQTTHVTVAVKGISWTSPDCYPMLVMHSAPHCSCPCVSRPGVSDCQTSSKHNLGKY
ncbi:hypothetical protein V8E52_011544, partial [Russula decolorans]